MACGCNKNNAPARVIRTQVNQPPQEIRPIRAQKVVLRDEKSPEMSRPIHNYNMARQ